MPDFAAGTRTPNENAILKFSVIYMLSLQLERVSWRISYRYIA